MFAPRTANKTHRHIFIIIDWGRIIAYCLALHNLRQIKPNIHAKLLYLTVFIRFLTFLLFINKFDDQNSAVEWIEPNDAAVFA